MKDSNYTKNNGYGKRPTVKLGARVCGQALHSKHATFCQREHVKRHRTMNMQFNTVNMRTTSKWKGITVI